MTSIIDDFAAIREALPSAEPSMETEIVILDRESDRLSGLSLDIEEEDEVAAAEFERQAELLFQRIIDLPAVSLADACIQLDMLAFYALRPTDHEAQKLFDSINALVRALAGWPPALRRFDM